MFEIVDFKGLHMPWNIFVHDPHRAPVDPLCMPGHLSTITLTSSGATVAEGFDACGHRVVCVDLSHNNDGLAVYAETSRATMEDFKWHAAGFDDDFFKKCFKSDGTGKSCRLAFVESEQFFRPKAGGYGVAKLPIPKSVRQDGKYLHVNKFNMYEWSKAAGQSYLVQAALTVSKGRQQQPNKEPLGRKLTSAQFLQLRAHLNLTNAQLVGSLDNPQDARVRACQDPPHDPDKRRPASAGGLRGGTSTSSRTGTARPECTGSGGRGGSSTSSTSRRHRQLQDLPHRHTCLQQCLGQQQKMQRRLQHQHQQRQQPAQVLRPQARPSQQQQQQSQERICQHRQMQQQMCCWHTRRQHHQAARSSGT